jgi:acyl-coenzyme A thioesterase PaaI-like protein
MSDFPEVDTFDPFAIVRSDHGCFGCGDVNPIGLHLRFAPDGDAVSASFIPSPEHQGFGGIVHGGIISTILDEAMAWATAHAGFWAMTGDIRVRFRRPLNIGDSTVVTARVSGVRGRLVTTSAELAIASDGLPVATATATFVKVDAELEAAWRALYLRESDTITDDLREVASKAAATNRE